MDDMNDVCGLGIWGTCGRERQERHLSSIVEPVCLWSRTQRWRENDVHGNFVISPCWQCYLLLNLVCDVQHKVYSLENISW